MLSLYELERLGEFRMAEMERQSAQAALLREAASRPGPSLREQVALWLVALAARLMPPTSRTVGTSRAAAGPPPL